MPSTVILRLRAHRLELDCDTATTSCGWLFSEGCLTPSSASVILWPYGLNPALHLARGWTARLPNVTNYRSER